MANTKGNDIKRISDKTNIFGQMCRRVDGVGCKFVDLKVLCMNVRQKSTNYANEFRKKGSMNSNIDLEINAAPQSRKIVYFKLKTYYF